MSTHNHQRRRKIVPEPSAVAELRALRAVLDSYLWPCESGTNKSPPVFCLVVVLLLAGVVGRGGPCFHRPAVTELKFPEDIRYISKINFCGQYVLPHAN